MQQRLRLRLGLGEAADVEQQLGRDGALLGVYVHEQLAFLRARELVVDDDGDAHLALGQIEAVNAMLAVDNQERVGVFAESEQLARAIIMQLRARLGGKNDRAGRRAEAAVDILCDLARPALVEQALKAVDRVFLSWVHRAGRRQHVARQNQRIKAMLALGDEQSRVGDDFFIGVRLGAIRGTSLG